MHLISIILLSFSFFLSVDSDLKNKDLTVLTDLMTGTFSSQKQSETDSAFYSINLVMYPIWNESKKVKWLYVEQAVSSALDKPYRQRVYRLKKVKKGVFESKVYELPHPGDYIQSWKNPDLFNQINADSLIERSGCSVFLKKGSGNCFSGSTDGRSCLSTLRGATYATSKVEVCPGVIMSWDQGWDATGEQVWGAVKGGYIFDKIE